MNPVEKLGELLEGIIEIEVQATIAMVRNVKRRLERNPRRSANKLATELKISNRSVCRILKNELKQVANKQNDKVWLTGRSSVDMQHLVATGTQKPASAVIYRELVLEGCLMP
ncbi:hypothetical protein ANTQUA_LOCUS10400 [Anthophora quadrimaculata]